MNFDDLATRLDAEYSLFLFALTGRYQQMRAPGTEVSPRAISDLDDEAHQLASTFFNTAALSIEGYLQPMLEEASEALREKLLDRKVQVLRAIRAMVLENVQQVVRLARVGGGYGAAMKGATGAIGLLIQRQAGKIEFKVSDRAGRKWAAKTFMHLVVRDFAYQSWIDFAAESFTESGHDLMQTSKGEVFSLLGSDGYLPFAMARPLYFHPNSHRLMSPYVPT